MSRHHSIKQILLLLLAVLLASFVIVRVLQSTNNLRYLWIGMSMLIAGHMVMVRRGPITVMMLGLVYMRAVMLVV